MQICILKSLAPTQPKFSTSALAQLENIAVFQKWGRGVLTKLSKVYLRQKTQRVRLGLIGAVTVLIDQSTCVVAECVV